MIIRNQNPDFVGDKKLVSFSKADIDIPPHREYGHGLGFQFMDDETNHKTEAIIRKSADGKYALISIARTTNNPNELAAADTIYSMEQIACIKWALEKLAGPELEKVYRKVEDECVQL